MKRRVSMTLVFFIAFMVGSLQLIKEYREFNEFKRDEESFNEYKNKESDYLESKIENNDFDW
jgi:predicted nucleotide-binding protein (sugar kinase/HSP70/actin superfamily)